MSSWQVKINKQTLLASLNVLVGQTAILRRMSHHRLTFTCNFLGNFALLWPNGMCIKGNGIWMRLSKLIVVLFCPVLLLSCFSFFLIVFHFSSLLTFIPPLAFSLYFSVNASQYSFSLLFFSFYLHSCFLLSLCLLFVFSSPRIRPYSLPVLTFSL